MRADGHGERPVFRTASAYRDDPAWSPDGGKIAYIQLNRETKRTAVYTAKADGTSVNRIVEMEKAHGEEPIWSPDGTEIAYVVRDEIRWASRQIRFINLKPTSKRHSNWMVTSECFNRHGHRLTTKSPLSGADRSLHNSPYSSSIAMVVDFKGLLTRLLLSRGGQCSLGRRLVMNLSIPNRLAVNFRFSKSMW